MPYAAFSRPFVSAGLRCATALALLAGLAACAPVLVGSAVVGTTVVATDRRTTGIQLEDQSIEMRVRNAVSEHYGDAAQVTPSSYNRQVLLVGTVADESAKERIGRIAMAVENVAGVNNQLSVGQARTVSAAANDSLISSQVRAALIGTGGLPSNVFVITTHRNVVYLQGRVTQAEGDTAARVAAGLRGVQKVVKSYEYISEAEARGTSAQPTQSNADGTPTSSLSPAAPAAAAPQTSGGAQVIPIPAAP